MKNMTLVFLIVLLMAMTGCARVSKPSKYAVKGYTSNPDWSFARNVSTAAGLPDIDDIEIDEKARRELKDHTALEATVFSSMAYLSDLNQLGFATLPLSFLSWTVINNGPDLSRGRKVYAWMPRDMAETPEEAIDVFEQTLKQALDDAVKNIQLQEPYYFDLNQYIFQKALPGEKGASLRIKFGYGIKGGDCDQQICRFTLSFFGTAIDGKSRPYPGIAPDFLGGGEAWVFTRYTMFHPLFPAFVEKNRKYNTKIIIPTLSELSKHLPSWVFMCLDDDFSPDAKHAFPAVLNQDKAYLYIKPQTEDM